MGIGTFFRNLFGGGQSTKKIICRKIGNQFFAYRKDQGNYEQIAGPFTTCEQCRANYPDAECTH